MNKEIEIGGIYKHFKGHIVKVICIAKNTETMDEEVIYFHIKIKEYWARPRRMFNSLVDKEKYPDVKQIYRFEKIDSE